MRLMCITTRLLCFAAILAYLFYTIENLFNAAAGELSSTTWVIGITGAMCVVTIICCITVVFIAYKYLKRMLLKR